MIASIERVFQFKISLLGIQPIVWRRIQVPEHYTFWDLHVAIQDAMGWLDCHLHEFKIINPATGDKVSIGIPDEDMMDENEMLPGWELAIADYFSIDNLKAEYEYDFGDGWRHTVELEEIIPRNGNAVYPICIAGERSCPPEDCGGVWGYQDMLRILNGPNNKEHAEMLTWVGGAFDPDHFNVNEVNFHDPEKRWMIAFGQD